MEDGSETTLSIAVLEKSHIGFGASGRNGGWCYDGFSAGLGRVESLSDLDTAKRFGRVLRETVDEIGNVIEAEGIECEFHKGGSVEFLRNGGQLARAYHEVESAHRHGATSEDTRVLSAEDASEIGRAGNLHGGLWSSNTAALHPAKLALGLANAVERYANNSLTTRAWVRSESLRFTPRPSWSNVERWRSSRYTAVPHASLFQSPARGSGRSSAR